jgi:hypothetical protein
MAHLPELFRGPDFLAIPTFSRRKKKRTNLVQTNGQGRWPMHLLDKTKESRSLSVKVLPASLTIVMFGSFSPSERQNLRSYGTITPGRVD